MKLELKIKREILGMIHLDKSINELEIEKLWKEAQENDYRQDPMEEFRQSGEETKIECDWSRHYESKSVAKKLSDGSWVGWTYWYGGGKHGEPSEMDWMSDAYELDCVETEKLVMVREFKRKEVSE